MTSVVIAGRRVLSGVAALGWQGATREHIGHV